jgi:O-antigen/teichoic acid export membrane protein
VSQAKLRSDVAWNVASLGVLAVAGLALNVVIGERWGSAALGVFNQALAAYVLFSMAASAGLDRAALRAVAAAGTEADHEHGRERAAAAGLAALACAAALALPATALYWLASEPIAALLDSPGVARGIRASAPGLLCFALNKVLLGIVNGSGRLRAFALYQSLRYVLILAALLAAAALELDGDLLAGVFSAAEIALLLVVAPDVGRLLWRAPPGWRRELGPQFVFGIKSAGAGVLLELNAKVDLWMIGVYMSDASVGVYAYAAMFAEGIYQLLVALQNVVNPRLARHLALEERDSVEAFVRRGRWRAWAALVPLAALAAFLYPHVLRVLAVDPGFLASHAPFAILCAGIALAAGYLPFGQLLLMGNRPAWHTLLLAASVGLNVLANALLIPRLGLEGAALATALAMVASVLLLRALARGTLGLRI